MTYTNPRRKRSGHIVLDAGDRHVAVLPQDSLYARAEAGEFGEVAPAPEPTPEEIKEAERAAMEQARLAAYRAEADPLFFQWQAGEATEQEWLDARQSVRDRYPYPEES